MKTASDIFIEVLEQEGVEFIFGVPGEENLTFLDSIRRSTIKFIPTRHEQAAGFMAATVGRLTGNPGVCLSTLGPGATNLVTAVAYAQLGAMPAIFITGQKPIKSSKQGHFQIIDTVGMMRPLTKMTKQIVDVKLVESTVREAFKIARDERPGAVHLELPEDVASETISDYHLAPSRVHPRRPVAESKSIMTAIQMIEQAIHPLILVGAGANRKRVSNMLTEFINKTGIPFFTTQMGKGVVSEQSTSYLGTASLSQNDYLHDQISKADLIINIGHDTIEKPPFLANSDHSQKIIHLNFSPATIDLVYNPTHEVIGDLANAIWQISQKITLSKHWDYSVFVPIKHQIEARLSDTNPHSPISIIKCIRKVMDKKSILTLDNGMYKLWFARHYESYYPNTILLDNALATMGAGLASAMAAKLVSPDQQVVAVCGDGGFMMNSQELETARRLGLNLVVIVLTDNTYGMISWKQAGMSLPDYGLSFNNPDFVKYAESYGITGHLITKTQTLEETLKLSINTDGVHLIAIPIDYSDNQFLGKKS